MCYTQDSILPLSFGYKRNHMNSFITYMFEFTQDINTFCASLEHSEMIIKCLVIGSTLDHLICNYMICLNTKKKFHFQSRMMALLSVQLFLHSTPSLSPEVYQDNWIKQQMIRATYNEKKQRKRQGKGEDKDVSKVSREGSPFLASFQ